MSDDVEELRDLVRSARAWAAWVKDSGVVDLPSEHDLSRELEALSTGGLPDRRLDDRRLDARPPDDRPPGEGRGAGGGRGGAGPAPRSSDPTRDANARDTAPRSGAPSVAAAAPGEIVAAPPVARVAPGERRAALQVLAEEAAACTRCRLHASRTRSVFSRGNPDAELVFVGEGPGYNEDQQGAPFVGAAGQLLDKMIAGMGMSPDDVYICNAVKCRPPDNRKPEADELAACAPFLQRQLELIQPKVIVALGATGVQALIGSTAGITRIRGTWKLYKGRIPIMPTFHPAYLLRSPDKKREVWDDLKQVLARLGRSVPAPRRRS